MTTLVAACTEDYTDWAKPQTHPQGELKNLTAVVDSVKAIDMNVLGEQSDGAKVEVLKTTVTGAPRSAFSHQITFTPAEGLVGDRIQLYWLQTLWVKFLLQTCKTLLFLIMVKLPVNVN